MANFSYRYGWCFAGCFCCLTPFFDKLNLFRTTDQKNWGGSGTGIAFSWNAQKLELDNDIKLLDEYNSKIANLGTSTGDLTQRQIIWNDTIGKGSDSLRSAVKVSDDAAVSSKASRIIYGTGQS